MASKAPIEVNYYRWSGRGFLAAMPLYVSRGSYLLPARYIGQPCTARTNNMIWRAVIVRSGPARPRIMPNGPKRHNRQAQLPILGSFLQARTGVVRSTTHRLVFFPTPTPLQGAEVCRARPFGKDFGKDHVGCLQGCIGSYGTLRRRVACVAESRESMQVKYCPCRRGARRELQAFGGSCFKYWVNGSRRVALQPPSARPTIVSRCHRQLHVLI